MPPVAYAFSFTITSHYHLKCRSKQTSRQPTSTSRPKSCTSRMKSFDEKPSPPSRKSPSVWQSLAGLSPHSLIAASIVSTAMDRYVVHFPPAIVTSPLLLTRIKWLRAIEAVLLELGSITKGRIPLQAARTSPRRTEREVIINLHLLQEDYSYVQRDHTKRLVTLSTILNAEVGESFRLFYITLGMF